MDDIKLTRRELLQNAAPAALAVAGLSSGCQTSQKKSEYKYNKKSRGKHSLGHIPKGLPPVRTVTQGPKFHWFGYYDKLEFDPTQRYLLGMDNEKNC